MSRSAPTNVPIATGQCNSAVLTPPWFVQGAEYCPDPATFKPLVNGAEAFGAVYDAIAAAKRTVDIICWGFQPSMYFKRGPGGQGSLQIGDLLETMGKKNVEVRLLVWSDGLHAAQLSENMMPGNNGASLSAGTRSPQQQTFDWQWYRRANLTNVTRTGLPHKAARALTDPTLFAGAVYGAASGPMRNIEFATRDFAPSQHAELAWRTWLRGADTARSTGTKAINAIAMAAEPTHHQKMVLVDYETPERAVGFVMGHNTLDEYWDTDGHSCRRMAPQQGRNGAHPRQDISSRVTGPILWRLNQNFCQAWDDATGQNLKQARAGADAATKKTEARKGGDTRVMAQILRTQAQHGKDGIRDIEAMYLQAVNNATNFIYIENQYFRFPPLAEKLKNLVACYQAGGRKEPLHLFVVTNDNKEGIGPGTYNTYRMLDALGKADRIDGIAKLERTEALQTQYEAARKEQAGAQGVVLGMEEIANHDARARPGLDKARQAEKAKRDAAEKLKTEVKNAETTPIPVGETPGLKVHICSLVAPDSPPGKEWEYVYVHAKLMIVDDVFMTLGSANINTRSMMVDSELNICHEHMGVTQPLRERLWNIHTKGMGVGKKDKSGRMDAADAFKKWGDIMKENKKRIKNGYKESPYASLVEFHYDKANRSYAD